MNKGCLGAVCPFFKRYMENGDTITDLRLEVKKLLRSLTRMNESIIRAEDFTPLRAGLWERAEKRSMIFKLRRKNIEA